MIDDKDVVHLTTPEQWARRMLEWFETHPPSYDPALDQCMYRSKDSACAVGCVLSDNEAEDLDDPPEGVTVDVKSLLEAGYLPDRFADHVEFLQDCQNAHDDYFDGRTEVVKALRRVFERHGLDV